MKALPPWQTKPAGFSRALTGRHVATAAISARWHVHARMGARQATVELLQEWLRDVAGAADAPPDGASIRCGAIGTPETSVEVQLEFDSLAALERFWQSVPAQPHRAWLQRLQSVVSDAASGPQWTVLHCIDVPTQPSADANTSNGASSRAVQKPAYSHTGGGTSARAGGVRFNADAAKRKYDPLPSVSVPSSVSTDASSGLSIVTSAEDADAILSADATMNRARLPSNRNSVGPSDRDAGRIDAADALKRALLDASRATSSGRASSDENRRSSEKQDSEASSAKPPQGPIRIGRGFKIPAGGAIAGSRLGAMVGDEDYYKELERQDKEAKARKRGQNGSTPPNGGAAA